MGSALRLKRLGGGQKLMALAQQKMIRHPGDVVANDSMPRLALSQIRVMFWHPLRMLQKKTEQRIERGHRALALLYDRGIGIDVRREKALQAGAFPGDVGTESGESLPLPAHVL